MKELKETLEMRIMELDEIYDFYLRETEKNIKTLDVVNKRLNEIRIQINTYKEVINLIEGE